MNHLGKLIIFVILVFSCNSKLTQGGYLLFEPINNLTLENITSHGYTKVLGVDMPVFEMIDKDTIRTVTFDSEQKTIRSTTWRIKIDEIDQEKTNKFLGKYGFSILQDFCTNQDSFCYFRYLYNAQFNEVYRVITDTIENRVNITCFYPLTEIRHSYNDDFFLKK